MGFDGFVFLIIGFKDALTPTHLATAGVLALSLLLFRHAGQRAEALAYSRNFLVVLLGWGIVYQAGAVFYVLSWPFFTVFASASYLVLGLVFLLLGGMFWRAWLLLRRGQAGDLAGFMGTARLGPGVAGLLGSAAAAWLVTIANIFPAESQAQWQGSMLLVPGKFFTSLAGLAVYEVLRNAPSLFVMVVFFGLRTWRWRFVEERRALLSIIMAACYAAVGCALVYFFYNRF